ncbi:hypothetical protein C8R44DRAFT_846044 [Mycena epipterygia]|nr:hypothetical protein C8R44DRAFT_846044 [Mycena epipterygia]
MRGLNALPLDDDILDRILTFCPTFASLEATMLVSKAFYRVFQTHPKSIAWAVAYNVVGPAFPQALRVIRFPYPDPDGTSLDPAACPENRIASMITPQEKAQLEKNSRVPARLEDIYSLMNKDRTSKTSVLSMAESYLFRRAVYRFMLYSKIFPGDVYSELEEIEKLSAQDLERVRGRRAAVLAEYPTDELVELHIVVLFLRGVVENACGTPTHYYADFLLAAGPAGVLRAYFHRSFTILEDVLPSALLYEDHDNVVDRLYAGYFAHALNSVWTARGVLPPNEDAAMNTVILDSVHGESDTCSRCPAPGGVNLLTEANWTRLVLDPDQLLKGHLVDNLVLRIPFLSHPAIARIRPESFGGVLVGNHVGGVHVQFQPGPLVGWGEDESGGEADYEDPAVVAAARVMDRFITRLFADEIRDVRAREMRAAGLVSTSTSIPTTTSGAALALGTYEDFSTWTQGDSYCEACLRRFIVEHVWVWFRKERIAAGWIPPEDCWYGYDCRTQMTSARHAETKNHSEQKSASQERSDTN